MVSKEALEQAIVAAVEIVDAQAGCISQMLGDVLLQVVEHVPGGGTLRTGHGYLVSDYPATQDVLTTRETRVVSVADRDSDVAEVALLRNLGYDALLMLPLVVDGAVWGSSRSTSSAAASTAPIRAPSRPRSPARSARSARRRAGRRLGWSE